MKNLKTFLALALIAILSSCSKSDDAPAVKTDPAVKEIAFTQTEIALPIQSRPVTSFFWVSKNKNADVFYIHNDVNNQTISSRGMYKYTASSNTFIDLSASTNVIAAGEISTLVNDGNYMYYATSNFERYNIASNIWENYNANYPATASDNNGEAGTVAIGTKIYFIGGRLTSKQRVKYFDTVSKTWTNGADYPPTVDNSNTIGPNVTNDGVRYIYTRSKVGNDFYRYDIQTNTWLKMADCPVANIQGFNNLNIMTIIGINTIVLVGSDKKIYAYNIAENSWQATSAIAPNASTFEYHLETTTDKNGFYIVFRKASDQLGLLKYTLNP